MAHLRVRKGLLKPQGSHDSNKQEQIPSLLISPLALSPRKSPVLAHILDHGNEASWSDSNGVFTKEDLQLSDSAKRPDEELKCKHNTAMHQQQLMHDENFPLIETNDLLTTAESPQIQTPQSHIQDLEEQINKLRFQYEANKDQKSQMNRIISLKDEEIRSMHMENRNLAKALSEKEILIMKFKNIESTCIRCYHTMKLTCEGELQYLRGINAANKEKDERLHSHLTAETNHELAVAQSTIRELNEQIERLALERNQALQAKDKMHHHFSHVQQLEIALSEKEKTILDLRHQRVEYQLKCVTLEDGIAELKDQVSQDKTEELKEELRERTIIADRQRNDLKLLEHELKSSKDKLLKSTNLVELLRGAAHLVIPHSKCKLPKTVFACTECYGNNIPCDDKPRCDSCKDKELPCIRWKCSYKHKLGGCPSQPCNLYHDAQGWLMLRDKRPQW